MFQVNPNPTFSAAVELSVPGVVQPLEVQFTFKHKGKKELTGWIADAPQKDDASVLSEVIVGWSGMKDSAGADVAYSFTALSDLLDAYPASHGEIFRTYLNELTASKRKN